MTKIVNNWSDYKASRINMPVPVTPEENSNDSDKYKMAPGLCEHRRHAKVYLFESLHGCCPEEQWCTYNVVSDIMRRLTFLPLVINV